MPSINPTIIGFWKSSENIAFQEENEIYKFYETCIFENIKENQNLENVFLNDKEQRYINIVNSQFEDFQEIEDWLIDIAYNVKTFVADFKNQIMIYQQNQKIEKIEIPYGEEEEDDLYYDRLFEEDDFSKNVDQLEQMLIETFRTTQEIQETIQSLQESNDKVGKYSYSVFRWMKESVNKKNTNNAVTLDTLHDDMQDVHQQLASMSTSSAHCKKESSNTTNGKTNSRFSFTESLLFLFIIFVILIVIFKL